MKWEAGYYIRLERDQSEIIFFSENIGKMILLSSFELNVGVGSSYQKDIDNLSYEYTMH
jgi:hypothetical protein